MKKEWIRMGAAALLTFSVHALAAGSMLNDAVMLEYAQEEQTFYKACFENARQNMHNPDRDDPEYVYRNQAKYCDAMSEGARKYQAKQNMLWGLASDEDLPRDTAILTGYAALEQIVKIPREEMDKYYADAWLNISDPDRKIWKVHMNMAANYRKQQENVASYNVYVDADTGEVLDVETY